MNLLLTLLITLSILFLLFQLYPLFSSYKAQGKKVPVLEGVVPEALYQKDCYLLYFWAPQCGMCRGMSSIVDKLMNERDNLGKVDASEHPQISRDVGVMGTPALVIIEKGIVSKVTLGAKSEKAIRQMCSTD
ncbi:MAG: thioredoxin family protein [Thiotrichaceae bacterium]